MDSTMLSNMSTSYYKHSTSYNIGRTQVTQLVPNVVWKKVYADFLLENLGSLLQEKISKIGWHGIEWGEDMH